VYIGVRRPLSTVARTDAQLGADGGAVGDGAPVDDVWPRVDGDHVTPTPDESAGSRRGWNCSVSGRGHGSSGAGLGALLTLLAAACLSARHGRRRRAAR
jgi:hypothetical protein